MLLSSLSTVVSRLILTALAVAGIGLVSDSANAAQTLLDQDRGVFSRATSAEDGEFDEVVTPDEATDFSNFNSTANASSSTTDGTAGATTTQNSTVDGDTIQASGTANSDASTSASDAQGEAPTDSFFELIFEATATETLPFTGNVNADATLGDGYASVELYDLDTDTQVASFEAIPGENFNFFDSVSLTAGREYRLTAFAVAYANADGIETESGDASFSVALGEVIGNFVPSVPALSLGMQGVLAVVLGSLGILAHRMKGRRQP